MKYNTTSKIKELTGSRKPVFILITAESVYPTTGWLGGSRSYYSSYKYGESSEEFVLQCGDNFSIKTPQNIIPRGWIVIETGTFCGKSAAPIITCREDELEKVKAFLGVI